SYIKCIDISLEMALEEKNEGKFIALLNEAKKMQRPTIRALSDFNKKQLQIAFDEAVKICHIPFIAELLRLDTIHNPSFESACKIEARGIELLSLAEKFMTDRSLELADQIKQLLLEGDISRIKIMVF